MNYAFIVYQSLKHQFGKLWKDRSILLKPNEEDIINIIQEFPVRRK